MPDYGADLRADRPAVRLMERRGNLRAYGLNLLGSLLGVIVMLVASLLWTAATPL